MGSQRVGYDSVTKEQECGREGVTQTELVGGAQQGRGDGASPDQREQSRVGAAGHVRL